MDGLAEPDKVIKLDPGLNPAPVASYRLTKKLQVLTGNRLANTWDAAWTDAKTDKKMVGRGTEIWTTRGHQIAVWDATFNVWELGGKPMTPVV